MSDRNTHTGHDANLVHCDFDALAIGQNVRLVFEPS